MKALVSLIAIALVVGAFASDARPAATSDDPGATRAMGAAKIDNSGRCDINNLDFVVTNHGSLMYELTTGTSGLLYPKGTGKTAVYAAGLWLGGKVDDSLRVTVGEYSQEFAPGPMVDGAAQPDNARFRVYRITRGDTTSADYRDWPIADGAPVDSLGRPAVTGDITLWCVYNDADPTAHLNSAGKSAPLGIEVQQSVFAFNQQNPLGDCAFMRFLLINKGGNQIDSMFISFWADPDLGGALDDLVGCDARRSIGYCYNATNTDQYYGKTPPAVGFDFFQGPLAANPEFPGQFEPRPMTSFNRYTNGTDPRSAVQSYRYMQGLNADGTPYENVDGEITPFQLAGDPVTGEGDIDEGPSDRRMMLSSGPFEMAPGDSQEIVIGVVLGQGANRLSSIRVLQKNDDFAQAAYDRGFRIASPPPAPWVSARPFRNSIDLVWGSESVGDISANEALGQEYHFQGYNVYQGESFGGPWRKVATYDEVDSIAVLYDEVFSPDLGTYQRVVVQNGVNEGLTNHLRITSDAIRGGKLVNNREYYFAVTAYSYDVLNTEPYEVGGALVGHLSAYPLESGIAPVRVRPAGSGAVLTEEAGHIAGTGDGEVQLEYLDPHAVETKDYRVTFAMGGAGLSWSLLEEGVTTKTLLEGQTKFDGDYAYPVVNGIMVRVIGPEAGAKRLVEVCADGAQADVLASAEAGNCTGEWYIDPLGDSSLDRLVRFEPPYDGNHDYEVRFVDGATEYAWDFFGVDNGEHSGVFPSRVPWEVWDIGINTPDDPADDVRITAMVFEQTEAGAGEWGWGDGIYFRNIPHDDVDWASPTISSAAYDPNEERLGYGRLFFYRVDGDLGAPQPAAGTRVRLVTNKTLTPEDVFAYRSKAVGTADGTVLTSTSTIYPVPNPYYNRSAYELSSFDRILRFAYLPPKPVTIRIFNLAGDLVRTLSRDDTTEGNLDWDLLTENGITVASGIYFWVADVEGAAAQKGKMAIFVEKERLNTY